MDEVIKKRIVSLAEVKEILDKQDPESLDQIQRWTYDYVSKFVKIDPKDAVKMKQKLVKECELTEVEAVDLSIFVLHHYLNYVRSLLDGKN